MAALLGITTDTRLGQQSSPQRLRECTEDLLLRWLSRLSARGPLLLVVEDLHWADPSTLEFLSRLVQECHSERILCILTFRNEFTTPWRGPSHQSLITLNRLTKRQIDEMLCGRLNNRGLPQAVVERIVERTDGVPLFIEEFSKLIQESGILEQEAASSDALLAIVPPSLQEMLVARLDRMASNIEVVQLASTIGREFAYRLLAAVSDLPAGQLQAELDKLTQAELLFKKGRNQDAYYIFKHALLQDSAYNLLLTERRQRFHLRIANALEQHFPEVVRTQPELLAQHLTKAGQTRRAAEYWLAAGLSSLQKSANPEAISHLQQGQELLKDLPPGRNRDALELQFGLPLSAALMGVKGYAAPEVEPVQKRCIELSEQLGDQTQHFPVLMANWAWMFIRGRTHSCLQRCDVLHQAASLTGDAGMLTEAHWAQACTSYYHGDFPTALRMPRQALPPGTVTPALTLYVTPNKILDRYCWSTRACRCGIWVSPSVPLSVSPRRYN